MSFYFNLIFWSPEKKGQKSSENDIPYARHHNPLLIRNCSWILTIHKDRILWKNLLEIKEIVLKIGVKNTQTAGYNGARTLMKQIWVKSVRVECGTFTRLEFVSNANFSSSIDGKIARFIRTDYFHTINWIFQLKCDFSQTFFMDHTLFHGLAICSSKLILILHKYGST